MHSSIQKAVKFKSTMQENNFQNSIEALKGVNMYDIITSILKPELQNWLNSNLPEIVNNVVEKEIKKLMDK